MSSRTLIAAEIAVERNGNSIKQVYNYNTLNWNDQRRSDTVMRATINEHPKD